jgi:sodium-dependent dicarboxylate transporter 2/3/5
LNKKVFIFLGPFVFFVILITGPYGSMSAEAHAVLAGTAWIALWWVTEAIPIAATALLPLVLFPLTGGMDIKATASAFGNKMIFLYLGGFIIAIAIEKWNLHRRIALNVIYFIGTDMRRMVLGFMIATAFLSMWISNTATTVMMLPIGLAIVSQLKDGSIAPDTIKGFARVLMLGIAYASSMGGISTLIGTPPNLVLTGVVEEFYGQDIAFGKWFLLVFFGKSCFSAFGQGAARRQAGNRFPHCSFGKNLFRGKTHTCGVCIYGCPLDYPIVCITGFATGYRRCYHSSVGSYRTFYFAFQASQW